MLLLCRAAEVVVSAKKGRLDPIFQRHFDASFKNVKQEFDKDQQEVGHKKAHAISHKTFRGLFKSSISRKTPVKMGSCLFCLRLFVKTSNGEGN